MSESSKLERLNIEISPEAAKILEKAKNSGVSKKRFVDLLAVISECFDNLVSLEATTPEVLKIRFMRGMRKEALDKGATVAELAAIDEAIKVQESVLNAYRKKEDSGAES